MHLCIVSLIRRRHVSSRPLNHGPHTVARFRQDLVHTGEDLFRCLGQRELQHGDRVITQPALRMSQTRIGVVHGLAHADDHEGAKHVAGAAEVAVDGWEDDLEEAGLAGGGHGRADDGEMRGWVIGGFEVDRGDDNVRNFVLVVHDLDGSMQAVHVGDFTLGEQPNTCISMESLVSNRARLTLPQTDLVG